jgi:hypothetical protein
LESQTSGTKQEREEREQMDERTLEEDEEAKERELSVCHAACCSSDAAGETNRDRDGIQTEVRCNAREGRKGGDDEAEDGGGGGGGGDVVGVMEEDEEGWRWRKYGRKRVPGRSSSADAEGAPARGELRHYYRCAVEGCPARRQVETRGTQVVLRRLQGQHNHAGASSRRAQVQTQAQLAHSWHGCRESARRAWRFASQRASTQVRTAGTGASTAKSASRYTRVASAPTTAVQNSTARQRNILCCSRNRPARSFSSIRDCTPIRPLPHPIRMQLLCAPRLCNSNNNSNNNSNM